MAKANDIQETLKERGERYGSFNEHAGISQRLKFVMQHTEKWSRLRPSQRESLEMIMHKVARILNGDPDYDDSWRDIVGYSQLVLDELVGAKEEE